jgi:predicted DNA-binding transcriptional regulator AlpA
MNEYMGTGEIKKSYGITRVQVWRLIEAGDFPEPIANLARGRLWRAEDVATTIERLRRLGRITHDGRLVPWQYLDVEDEDRWPAEAIS